MRNHHPPRAEQANLTLFLSGDLMLGRGLDQLLPHSGDPRLYEDYAKDARDYLRLAEAATGPLPGDAGLDYPWGCLLPQLARRRPDLRLVNLETSISTSPTPWPGKAIHYRMHPDNAACLTLAGIDLCLLANNHVLDFGPAGLEQTLDTLARLGVQQAGAGRDLAQATAPVALPGLQVLACGHGSSGIPPDWAATPERPGVLRLPDLSPATAEALAGRLASRCPAGQRRLLSIHWGPNWDFGIEPEQQAFAHRLIDAGVDLVLGHSSHHVKGIEIYRQRLILYGAGDLLNDYEGIRGYEAFRGDLGLLYWVSLGADGRLQELSLTPVRTRQLRLEPAGSEDRAWLRARLAEAGRLLGTWVEPGDNGDLALRWH